jgi:DNA modification methylase
VSFIIHHGDALDVLRGMPDASVDAVVTDPPAGIGFMGKKWDTVGAMVERPADTSVAWDRVGGNHHPENDHDRARTRRSERGKFVAYLSAILAECYRVTKPGGRLLCWSIPRTMHWTGCAVEDAGWVIENTIAHMFGSGFPKAKSQLKPGREDWWLARKPGPKVLPLNIDACRIAGPKDVPASVGTRNLGALGVGWGLNPGTDAQDGRNPDVGRWPANVVLDEDAAAELDAQSGTLKSGFMPAGTRREGIGYHGALGTTVRNDTHGDTGGASRFFYVAKASTADRNAGGVENKHPTVKSTELMRYLVRLVKPLGVERPRILDPFTGSGSTGRGALLEGCDFTGIEREAEHVAVARARVADILDGVLPLTGVA